MKSILLVIGGLCGAVAALMVLESRKKKPVVEDLAHRLETAWADHHTVV